MASITVIYCLYKICLVGCFCAEVIFEFNTSIFHTFARYYFWVWSNFSNFYYKRNNSGGTGGTANTYHIHHKRNWEDGEIQNPGDHLNEKVKNDVWKFLIWTFVFQDSTLIPKYINGQKVTCRLSMWCCTVGNYLSRD